MLAQGEVVLKQLEKIKHQTKLWLWYGRLSPVFFLVGSAAVFSIFNARTDMVLYASWCVFIASALTWWGWVIKVVIEMTNMFTVVLKIMKELHGDIKEVHVDIKKMDTTRKQ
jgi:hypothetical protein